jgi:protein SCO1/2
MNPVSRKIPLTILVGLALAGFTLLLAYLGTGVQSRAQRTRLPVLGTVPDFTLTNESGAAFSLADLRGHVWLADIIFTRCPGPCLKMTRQMKEIEDAIPASSNTRFVTLTTDPDYDQPQILQRYAARFDADTNRWIFLTGTRVQTGLLAANGLKLSAVEKPAEQRVVENDLFIHSTRFVVMDKHAQLRGVFDTGGEGVDWNVEKQKILAAIKQLEREQ